MMMLFTSVIVIAIFLALIITLAKEHYDNKNTIDKIERDTKLRKAIELENERKSNTPKPRSTSGVTISRPSNVPPSYPTRPSKSSSSSRRSDDYDYSPSYTSYSSYDSCSGSSYSSSSYDSGSSSSDSGGGSCD